ncbi:cellulose binding domain-containing protein [Hamadaea tsunoensis]|uniref:cellulose binding domain-containing protein n=1 Tax=Hamadaea tsunoensis TaxID=53368 RepID=UPI0003F9A0C5|nr:cellulose binding domain-containing protein [Hamadaea tsunoensis]
MNPTGRGGADHQVRALLAGVALAGRSAAVLAWVLLDAGHRWPVLVWTVPALFAGLSLSSALTTSRRWVLAGGDLVLAVLMAYFVVGRTPVMITAFGSAGLAGALLGWPGVIAGLVTVAGGVFAPLGGVAGALISGWVRAAAERIRESRRAAAAAERARLAREMHDSLSKTLDALALGAAALPTSLGEPDRAVRLAASLREGSLDAARDARAIIDDLRSPALSAPLADTVRAICDDWSAVTGLPAIVRTEPVEVSGRVAAELSWILREALRNVAEHSRASHAEVRLAAEGDAVRLEVRDDGTGFAEPDLAALPRTGRHGLVGMTERARLCGGSLSIFTLDNTRIVALVPRHGAAGRPGIPRRLRFLAITGASVLCGALVIGVSVLRPSPFVEGAGSGVTGAASSPSAGPSTGPSTGPNASAQPKPSGSGHDGKTASPAAADPAALACHVKYTKRNQWEGGFVADVTIVNTGTTIIDGWQLTFAFPLGDQKLTSGWAAIWTQTGRDVLAEDTGTPALRPGDSILIGFQGTFAKTNPVPSGYSLNGTVCR